MKKEQAIDLCRKINELVKGGVGGEQESAKMRLKQLMQKHGIEPHDVEGEEIVEVDIVCSEEQRKFAVQIICSVLGRGWKGYKYKKRYFFTCPVSKVAEIKDRWEHYKKQYEQELEMFYSAFIQKNRLYVKPDESEKQDEEDKPLTPEEKDRLRRLIQMMEGMEYSDHKKKLNNASHKK